MSLLNRKYTRLQPQPETEPQPNTVTTVLETEESHLINAILDIEEAKSRERTLRERLNVVQQSLQAFRALEAAPEPVQEQQAPPPPVAKNVRKAATKKTATPTQRSIAPEPTVGDTENIELVHDDFATFPE
jgi:hypothetical protein